MLVITAINISKLAEVSNYKYEVWVARTIRSKKIIAKGRIKKHRRSDGWRELIQRILDESKDVG